MTTYVVGCSCGKLQGQAGFEQTQDRHSVSLFLDSGGRIVANLDADGMELVCGYCREPVTLYRAGGA